MQLLQLNSDLIQINTEFITIYARFITIQYITSVQIVMQLLQFDSDLIQINTELLPSMPDCIITISPKINTLILNLLLLCQMKYHLIRDFYDLSLIIAIYPLFVPFLMPGLLHNNT